MIPNFIFNYLTHPEVILNLNQLPLNLFKILLTIFLLPMRHPRLVVVEVIFSSLMALEFLMH